MLAHSKCCKNMITFLKPSHLKTYAINNMICLSSDLITKYSFFRHSTSVERKGKEIVSLFLAFFFLSIHRFLPFVCLFFLRLFGGSNNNLCYVMSTFGREFAYVI